MKLLLIVYNMAKQRKLCLILLMGEIIISSLLLVGMVGELVYLWKSASIVKQLKEVGILHLADRKAAVLSGGEKQRVAIARALINNPQYILADEPTGALDTKTAGEIINILCELNRRGKTLLIVTHDDKVAGCCQKVCIMEDGIIVKS